MILKQSIISLTILGLVGLTESALAAGEYTFEITNQTTAPITEVWASEDGETWSTFDLGKTSIPPKGSTTLVWDESTYDSGCVWWLQVVFKDGSESEALQFDFCENPDIVITEE